MPSSISVRTASQSLKNKGFREDRTGDHVYWVYHCPETEEATEYRAKVSHGPNSQDLGNYHYGKMVRRLGLQSLQEVHRLLSCDMTQPEYAAIISDC